MGGCTVLIDGEVYSSHAEYSDAESFVYRHSLYEAGRVTILMLDGAEYIFGELNSDGSPAFKVDGK